MWGVDLLFHHMGLRDWDPVRIGLAGPRVHPCRATSLVFYSLQDICKIASLLSVMKGILTNVNKTKQPTTNVKI